MSLNGLDDAKVREAHDIAAVEPGGWFLLKYAARDEVELLAKGNGGIVEIRNTIARFEEPAPLFGFLRYRRRNVVIKYVPEECSRLMQARVVVHFLAITERFSPHDTEFSITSPKELRDTTLSAACSLHTASGSISSSTSSLRRRRLLEIAEVAEEDAKRQSTVLEERPSTAKAPSIAAASVPLPASPPTLTTAASYRSVISDLDTSPPPPKEPITEIRPRSPTKVPDERRKSSQSVRPDFYSLTSYGSNGKPKIKLGPRPSLDVGGKPHTSSVVSPYRPVSTLPAGLSLFSRGSKKEKTRPESQMHTEPPLMTISPPPVTDTMAEAFPIPQTRPHTSGGRPTTISDVSMTSAASPKPLAFPNTPRITPEKARLMKALELRKKRAMPPPPILDTRPATADADLAISAEAKDESNGSLQDEHDTLSILNDITKADDSGIAFDTSSIMKADESDATRSDSYPVSPVGASERAESTTASSISESTDETIQEAHTSKTRPGEAEVRQEEIVCTTEQHQETNKPLQEETEHKIEAEKLPPLTPMAYTPIQSPVVAEAKHVEEASPTTVEDSTPTDLAGSGSKLQSIPWDVSQDDMLSKASVPETDLQLSNIEAQKREFENTPQAEPVDTLPSPLKTEIKEWKVPRSKFSSQSLKAASEVPLTPTEPMPLSPGISAANFAPKSPVDSTFSVDTERSLDEDDQQESGSVSSKRRKRRALIEPIRTDLDATDISAADTEANISSDDELMEELQSAVVQEAKPISVSKSPISPLFPSPKKKIGNPFSRAFSSPMRKEAWNSQNVAPPELGRTEPSRSASASAAYLNRINQEPSKPLAKKVNLGSGISQRIKALEKLSATSPGATPSTSPSAVASPAFFSVRKGNIRTTSSSHSVAERANSFTRNSPSPSPSASRESSPETSRMRERSGSIQNRLAAFNNTPVLSQPQQSRPESISVTAKIIRDPNQPFPKSELGKDPSDYAPLDLKQSPLLIDHQKAIVIPEPTKGTIQERRLSTSSRTTTKSRRSSITVVIDLIEKGKAHYSERRRSMNLESSPASPSVLSSGKLPSRPPSVHQSPVHHRPVSNSSRRSSRDTALSPPPTAGSFSSTNDEKDKKSNRASRIMRRMSASLSSGRKTLTHAMSPTVREESEPLGQTSGYLASSHPSNDSMTPSTTSTNIGDVNVQFPDTLLWKRRSMLLDSQGFLILSPALSNGNNAKEKTTGATRRFHLSEFRTPDIPDVEMQELPNSVVLDFIEGGGLQIACEDRAGQVRVLGVLEDAHRTWAAYGQ